MPIPKQYSWVVRKILEARKYIQRMQAGEEWLQQSSFSIKKFQTALLGSPTKVDWAKMICQNAAPPKCLFITWLLMHGRLATCSYLQHIGVQVESVCCLCEQAEETLDHLFFECRIAQSVWKEAADWWGVDGQVRAWTFERQVVISRSTNNNRMQKLYRCMFSVVVYYIWRERNLRRMKGAKSSIEAIVHQCKLTLAWSSARDRKLGLRGV